MFRLALLAALLVCPTSARAGSACPTNTAADHGPYGFNGYVLTGPTADQSVVNAGWGSLKASYR